MTTEPKIIDPVVFNYDRDHIKLTTNAIITSAVKQPLTYREAVVNENRNGTFSYNLDLTNGRDSDKLFIKLNRAGVYHISASVSKNGGGQAAVGLTIDVAFPGGAPFEIDYQMAAIADFYTVSAGVPLRILPNQIGTTVSVNVKTGTGSSVSTIRGYDYPLGGYNPGAESGSWVDITYLGP